jgi:hypothetical protein
MWPGYVSWCICASAKWLMFNISLRWRLVVWVGHWQIFVLYLAAYTNQFRTSGADLLIISIGAYFSHSTSLRNSVER